MLIEYEGKRPELEGNVFVAPTAVVIGDVVVAEGSSIWYGAVLRGDDGKIVIGPRTNVQDNAVLHTTPEHPTKLGEGVTIGHGALLEGCTIESGAVIGMGAVVLEGVVVGSGAMLAAGSVATPGTIIPPHTLWAGAPAENKKEINGAALRSLEMSATSYRTLSGSYLDQGLDKIS